MSAHLSLARALALLAVLFVGTSALSQEPEVGVQVGQQAPDFTLPQVDGDPVTLSDVVAQNDVTLLFFFFAAT